MSAKEIVTTLRSVAADPAHRGKLIKEQNCLSSLVKFLQHEDPDVYFTALEVYINMTDISKVINNNSFNIGCILAFTSYG